MPADPHRELKRFVELAHAKGHHPDRIRAFMRHKGYPEHLVDAVIAERTAVVGFVNHHLVLAAVLAFLVIGGGVAALWGAGVFDGSAPIEAFEEYPLEPITDTPGAIEPESPPVPPLEPDSEEPETSEPLPPEPEEPEPSENRTSWGGGGGSSAPPSDPDPEPEAPQTTVTITYAVDETSELQNPERGWLRQTTWLGGFETFRDEGFSVVWTSTYEGSPFRLDEFREGPISEERLDAIEAWFDAAREHGLKLKVRFSYNGNPEPLGPDASYDRIIAHLEQLAPMLESNEDVIAMLDAGFVGHWGEWHSSDNGLSDDTTYGRSARTNITAVLLSALPESRMIGHRKPQYVRELYGDPGYAMDLDERFTGTDQSRIGWLNDCFLMGASNVGTYDTWSEPQPDLFLADRAVFEHIGRYAVTSAETCSSGGGLSEYNTCEAAISEMETMSGPDLLNRDYWTPLIDRWQDDGCYDEITNRLGYRLALREATLPLNGSPRGAVNVSFLIENTGFGKVYNPRPLELVLKGPDEHRITIHQDARRFLPLGGETTTFHETITLPANLLAGTYTMHFALPDPSPSLADDPRYAIRLANINAWNASDGTNDLNANITIEGTPQPLEPGTGLLASYFDTTSAERVLVRTDSAVAFSWGTDAPHPDVPDDYFGVVWNGSVRGAHNASYVFSVRSDDGFRLMVDGALIAASWMNFTGTPGDESMIDSTPVRLAPWESVAILLEYYEANASAMIELLWRREGEDVSEAIVIGSDYLYPAHDPAPLPPEEAARAPPVDPTVLIGPQNVPSGNVSDGTLFASPTGSGTACTEQEPCSLTEAVSQTDPGDHLFLRDGTYLITSQLSLSESATSENPITIESYPGERAIIDGQHLAPRISIWGSHYTLRNMNVTRMNATGVYIGGTHNTIEGVNSYGNYLSGFQIFSPYPPPDYGAQGSYNTIRDCRAFNNSDAGFSGGNYANGGNADGISISSGTYNRIIRCAVYNNSDDGIDVWRSTETLVAYSIASGSGIADGDGVGFKMGGTAPSANAIVMHSISYDNQGVGFTDNSGTNVTMLYTTSYDNPYRSYFAWTDDHLRSSIAAGAGSDESLFGQGTETDNSWQRPGTVSFVSTDPDSPDFLRPIVSGGFEDIGVHAQSPFVGLDDIDALRTLIGS